MIGKEIKTLKQFLLDLDPDTRAEVFRQIVKRCHVTATTVRQWVRGETSPQEWRVDVINNYAKQFGCVIVFPPIKRKRYLEDLSRELELQKLMNKGGAL